MKNKIPREKWKDQEKRINKSTQIILELLDDYKIKATFFVLGWIADSTPDLVAEIYNRGHEIGTHGYSHQLLTEIDPETFEKDLVKSIRTIEGCIKQNIIGYRAPSFTITKNTQWAFEILARNGIKYDSSIFPINFHPDYGVPHAPLGIHKQVNGVFEFPMTCVEIVGKRIPCCGGGYFRIFPYAMTKYLIKRCNKEKRPAVFYLHPWEVDPDQPRVKLPWKKQFRHYHNLDKTLMRLSRLMKDFNFSTAREVLGI